MRVCRKDIFVGKAALRCLGFAMLFVVWYFASVARVSPALPSPAVVVVTTWELMREGVFTQHIAASLKVVLLGIAIAVTLGFSLGVLMFRYKSLYIAALPVIESVRGIAALTLFPLLIVLLGIDTPSRIFVIFWTAWPAVVLSTLNSLRINETITNAARVCGASEWRVMLVMRIPLASPGILTGVRIGISGGWIGLVAAEMLGATRGLGFFLLWSAQSFRFERVYATIIVIAVIGGVMNLVLLKIQEKLNIKFGG